MDSEKGESHLGPWFNGVTSLLPVWREWGGKGHIGRCAGEEGRDRCDNQVPCDLVPCGSKFYVPCGLRIQGSSDCVDVVAELMLSTLPESCHRRPENAASVTAVQGASCLGYIFIVLVGVQLPVPLSQPSRTTATTPGHWASLLSHWYSAAVAGQLV